MPSRSALSPQPSALLDDRTVAYVVESQPPFEDLRQVAAQLAGLLLLGATGSREAAPGHPMLESADALFKTARERIESTRASERTRPHRDSLLCAIAALAEALQAARDLLATPCVGDFDRALIPLRSAYDHLQQATRVLPGFRMVAFEQGCCAGHSSSGSFAAS